MAEKRTVVLWLLLAATVVGVVAAARVEDEEAPPARDARRRAPAAVPRAAGGDGVETPPRAQSRGPGSSRNANPDAAGLTAAATAIDLARLTRAPLDASAAAAIASAWEPPPPPPAPKAAPTPPPSPPRAPALPFRVIGRLIDGGNTQVFLQSGQVTLVARRGDLIERNYRVEEVNDKQVVFTYLPLNQKQQLAIGDAP